MRIRFLALAVLLAPWPVLAQAQRAAIAPRDLFRFRDVSDVALSPDGRQVAYTVTGLPLDGSLDSLRGEIHVVSADGSGDRVLSPPAHAARKPRWSPDGRQIAYVANDSGRSDIWLVTVSGGTPQRLTRTATGVGDFAWSPDGRHIAFVVAEAPDSALVARQRLVRLGDDPTPSARLWVVSVDSATDAQPLTDTKWTVFGEPSWSPDGTRIAVLYALNTGPAAVLESSAGVIDVATQRVTRLRFVGLPSFDPLAFSPDGKWIALTAQIDSARFLGGSAIYIVSVDGRQSRMLTEVQASIRGWARDGSGLILTRRAGTTLRPERLFLDGRMTELYTGPLVVATLSLNADRTGAVFAGGSLDRPAEVYVTALSSFTPRAITRINADVTLPPLGRTEVVRWPSYDGFEVEGLLTYPAGYTPGTRVPLLVVAHAGGETFYASYPGTPYELGGGGDFGSRGAWPVPVFTSRGYAVLRVNQRGGGLVGYGTDAALPAFRPKDRADRDILAGVDSLIEKGVADPERMAIMGWSNGALVTNSLITTTTRFAAASLMADFAYQDLNAGLNPAMALDLGGQPWENSRAYVEHSPIFALGKVKTPTLIVHGEADPAIPVAEDRALYRSLRTLGVPVQLATYPGMGHGPDRPAQVIDIATRNLAWFDRYLKPPVKHP